MAFDYTNLYPDTSGNGGYTKSWNYTTLDSLATVKADGYFNKVASRVGIGDNIIVAVVDAYDKTRTTLVEYGTLYVNGNSAGVVTTTITLPISEMPALTGDVTTAAGTIATTIAANAVTNAKMAPMPARTFKANNTSGAATPTDITIASFHRSYLAGLTLSTAGASTTFGIAAGVANDSTNVSMIELASAYTKTTSAWALGTAAGSLDTGSIANSTWYHIYLIQRPDTGVVDVLISLSASAPTMPTNYTLFRRIGSMKTNGSAQWTKFIQDGDLFQWDAASVDVNATNPGTAAVTRTLSTPLGVRVNALLTVAINAPAQTDNPAAVLISDLSISDQAPSVGAAGSVECYSATTAANLQAQGAVTCMTNTSSQVRSRCALSGSGTVIAIMTNGWIDRRGRDL